MVGAREGSLGSQGWSSLGEAKRREWPCEQEAEVDY